MPRTNRKPVGVYDRVGGKLGVGRLRGEQDLAALVEHRLPSTTVLALIQGGLSDAEAYRLILPRRTYSHRLAKNEPLSREESDRAVRIARVVARAEDLWGDADGAWRWLRQPNGRFDDRAPLEMLATEAGARVVEEVLLQVEDGMFA